MPEPALEAYEAVIARGEAASFPALMQSAGPSSARTAA
jgi:hypothetical protein